MDCELVKKKSHRIKKVKIIIGVFLTIIMLLASSYAFYRFRKTSDDQILVTGDIYMRFNAGNEKNITMMPSDTYRENDYFEFTINGTNTANKDIVYEILLNHGDNQENNKIRLDDDFLRFRLVELGDNDSETVLINEIGYKNLKDTKLYVDRIDAGDENVNKTYRLYTWVEGVIVGNVEEANYNETEWEKVYTNIKVGVHGDFTEKERTGSVKVTFNPNGGNVLVAEKYCEPGEKYGDLPIPIKTGKSFVGWYLEDTFDTLITKNSEVSNSTEITLYARYEIASAITLNINGGTNDATETITIFENTNIIEPSSITLPERTYNLSGFETSAVKKSNGATISNQNTLTSTSSFLGWYTSETGGVKVISNETTPKLEKNVVGYTDQDGNWIKDDEVTLHARYSELNNIELPTITKTGYTCGWTTDENGMEIEYQSGEEITPDKTSTVYGICIGNELTFENQNINKVYLTSSQTASITGASGGTGTYTYTEVSEKNQAQTTTNYISISGTTITIAANTPADTYTYVIRATDSDSEKTKDATYTIVISKADDTVNIEPKSTTYTGSQINANTGTSTSGTTITYTYYSSTNCTGDALLEAPVNVGNYSVKAVSAGNNNYNSGNKCVTHTITARNVTVTAASQSRAWNDTALTNSTCTAGSNQLVSGHTVSCTMTSGSTITTAGSVTNTIDTVTIMSGTTNVTGNYNVTKATGTLTVTKATPTLSLTAKSTAYTGNQIAANTVTASPDAGGAKSYEYYSSTDCTGTALSGAPTAVGNYSVKATVAAVENKTNANSICKTHTITRATTATTGACLNPTYNGSGQALASGGANVDYTNNSATDHKTSGTYSVTVTPKSNYAWSDGTYAAKTLNCNIAQKAVTVTAGSQSRAWNNSALTNNTCSAGANQLVSGHTVSCTMTSGSTITLAGSVTNTIDTVLIKNGNTDVTGNYNVTKVAGTLTVTKATPTLSLTAKSTAYTGNQIAANTVTASPDAGGNKSYTYYSSTDCSGTALSGAPTAVGNYSVKATVAAVENKTNANSICKTHTITRAKTATTGSCANPTYNGSSQALASGGANVDYANNSATDHKTSGTYSVTVTPKSNYAWSDGTYAAKTLNCNIAQKAVTVTAGSQSRAWNNSALTNNTCSAGANQLVSGHTVSCTMTSGSTITLAGSVTNTIDTVLIKNGNTDVSGNYNVTKATGTLTVTKATPTLSLTAKSAAYTGNQIAANTVSASPDAGGNKSYTYYSSTDCSGTALSGAPTAVGNYSVKATVAAVENKTNANSICKTHTITRATTATTGACLNPTYNGSSQALASGGANVDYTNNSATDHKTSGTYSVTVTPKSNYAWSDGTYAAKTLNCNIAQKAVTVTAGSQSRAWNNSALTNNTCSAGANQLVSGHTVTCTMTSGSTITLAGSVTNTIDTVLIKNGNTDVTGNYNVTKANGTLTVTKATPTLSLTAKSTAYTGNQIAANTVTASPDAGGAKSYEYYSSTDCSGTALSGAPTVVGNYSVKATVAAVANKTNQNTICKTHTITKATATNSVAITGTNTWGSTLTATITTNSPGTKGYQWYYNTEKSTSGGTAITGATSNTYTIAKDYVGKFIYVVASVGANDNYTTPSNTSAVTNSAIAKQSSCGAPSGVTIANDGKVTWTASSTATGYQISIDNTNFADASSGVDYNSTITASTGSRTVYVRSKCNTTYYTNANSTSVNKGTTVYSVTLTKGTGISAVTGAGNYITGRTVTLGATASTGYTWSKWTQTSGGANVSTTNAYSLTISNSNIAYTANATANTYSITYNLNSGTNGSGNPANYNITTSKITLTNPSKTGYTFTGWTEGQDTIKMDSDFVLPYTFTNTKSGNVLTSFKLQLNTESGTYLEQFSSRSSTGHNLTNYTFNRDTGTYKIRVAVNGSTQDYNAGYFYVYLVKGTVYNVEYDVTAFSSSSITVDNIRFYKSSGGNTNVPVKYIYQGSYGNRTFTANWTPNTYTVIYNGNGSTSGSTSSSSHTYDVVKTLTTNGFSKTGYTFVGWSKTNTSTSNNLITSITVGNNFTKSGENYQCNQTVSTADSYLRINANMTSGKKYVLMFNASGVPDNNTLAFAFPSQSSGNVAVLKNGMNVISFTAASNLTSGNLDDTAKDNRANVILNNFVLYETNDDLTNSYSDQENVKNLGTSGNVNLYALWKANTYTINYNMNGGSNPSTKPTSGTYNSNVQISNPGNKTVTVTPNANSSGATVGSATSGTQTFAGWTSTTTNGSPQTGSSSSNLAAWTPSTKTKNTYFKNLRNDTGTVTMVANWSGTVTLPTLTSPTGFTCKYYTAASGGSEMGSGGATWTIPNASSTAVTAYARCTANTYTISYTMNGGSNPSTKPTSGTYNSNVQISNPGNKTVTVTPNVNSSGATVGSATSGTQTFSGWTSTTTNGSPQTGSSSSNLAAWTPSTKTKNTYFKNLRNDTGTVTMIANWSGTVTLPTLTSPTGFTCKYYTAASGGSEMGSGGATWTIPNNSSTSVTAYARCTANTYTISYTMNGGSNPSTKPTSGTYNANVQISNPANKTVTVTPNVNSSGASVGSATSGTQTFAGWTSTTTNGSPQTGSSSSNLAAWTPSTKTKNTYFKNLRNDTGTVTMIANWSGTVTLPTLTSPTGYTCKYYTAASGGSLMGSGGATWTIPNASSTAVTAYARCTVNAISNVNFTAASSSIHIAKTTTTSLTYSGDAKSITYSSNNTAVATVNSSGVITGVSNGTATITVTLKDYANTTTTKTLTITVIKVWAENVSYTPPSGITCAGGVQCNDTQLMIDKLADMVR